MMGHPDIGRCSSLKYVVCGGEPMPLELRRLFHETLQGELYNLYGPTETTIQSAFHRCSDGGGRHTVPIGNPIANTQMYVLDRAMEPVPPGVYGELYIGGAGLARGYWQRPDLTAERFVPDPFSGREGDRLYRTGDLAARDTEGPLEFHGRVDHQIKIRGYRIEPGEIESCLNTHSRIRMAVVTSRENSTGDRRLIAYVVPQAGQALSADELRTYLSAKLPAYMVPAEYVMLKELPLTAGGKVRFGKLPDPEGSSVAHVAPASRMEIALADIWREVLGLPQPGLEDNFFDLGGHSLLIARIRLRLREKLRRDLPIVDFFAYPTIRSMAQRLEQGVSDVTSSDSDRRAEQHKQYLLRRRHDLRAN